MYFPKQIQSHVQLALLKHLSSATICYNEAGEEKHFTPSPQLGPRAPIPPGGCTASPAKQTSLSEI